ncbi:GATA-type transcription factor sreA [Dictyocoela muelleri]|nr:GATA-type transcription factor sreA [Dictyocoela muelleri]
MQSRKEFFTKKNFDNQSLEDCDLFDDKNKFVKENSDCIEDRILNTAKNSSEENLEIFNCFASKPTNSKVENDQHVDSEYRQFEKLKEKIVANEFNNDKKLNNGCQFPLKYDNNSNQRDFYYLNGKSEAINRNEINRNEINRNEINRNETNRNEINRNEINRNLNGLERINDYKNDNHTNKFYKELHQNNFLLTNVNQRRIHYDFNNIEYHFINDRKQINMNMKLVDETVVNSDNLGNYNKFLKNSLYEQQNYDTFLQKYWNSYSEESYKYQNIVYPAFQTRGHVYRTIKSREKRGECGDIKGGKICDFCKTTVTTLWRKSNDWILCNACGLYYKAHGVKRPAFLLSNFIKRRKKRSKNHTFMN